MSTHCRQQTYDHRLVRLVQDTRDASIATRLSVPRSTVAGWLERAPANVVTADPLDEDAVGLRARVVKLERRVRRLRAMLRVALALVRIVQPDLTRLRVPNGCDKRRLLRAIERSQRVLGLRRILAAIGLSPSRLSAWRRTAQGCELDDATSCPAVTPHGLTTDEVAHIEEMVTSPSYRHVPTGRLAMLAQRIGKIFASASTWYRLVKERGWRRPRLRVHPRQPREGIRAETPDEVWHIDTTAIRLLDGTKAFLQAVIDNFSRRILAWRVSDRRDAGTSVELLLEAGAGLGGGVTPSLLSDQGSENCNRAVDALIEQGLLRRVLAQVDVTFSNSLIEAWWRSLKHGWLFLHPMDSVTQVRRLVAFYVEEHNSKLPHSAFKGQTPDEMYFGTGEHVPDRLAELRTRARERRLEVNRARRCALCG